ncbi:hypothetical protein RGQ29_027041 [Quercus rubra]|uniref:AAA+ ATPase domain-containing protein n=1 Tax=Quercus rubra TaxID=3512 RepID=A0AAN7EN31_QUERU|nr:hypothetical protein RGQ29_027041 [Quercus rubra]
MEVVAAVVGAVVGALVIKPVNLLCSCVGSKIKTAVNLQSNIDAVKKEMKSLMDCKGQVDRKREAAEKEGNQIIAEVVTWLEKVKNLESRVNPIREKKPSACFLNCCKRYRESNEVEGILKEIERLLKDGNFESGVAYPTRIPRAVEHIPGPSIQGQTTASKNLYETLKVLHDDKVRRIGIWGMGGVGKTTLVKNLNNKLENASTQPFGIIIWVTVTRNLVIKNVQTRIAERLNLEVKIEESVEGTASRLYQRLEREENFLLILDDVWKEIELGELGVPQPKDHKGCKVILTSRRMEVCRNMMTDVEIKMEVLNDDEAWQLFSQKAAIEADHFEQIRPFAEAIAREGCGLPLAIITMGAAMRRKTKVELWKNALTELKRSVPTEDIEKKVFERLKWSYDSLEGNNIKSCFLYCSLFPEDFSIEISELVNYWKAEGLIDEGQNYEDSVNRGIALIENLKDSCLLEDGGREGTVKMHDVVRDVAIWIASSFEDNCKSLVRSGMDLSEISVGEFSNSDSLKRVSFMNNKITRLPDSMIQCSEASTLLLQNNRTLVTVPETFLQGFKALRVLNLSETDIRSLPQSLLQLNDLRALFLGSCRFLEELPPLGMLSKLQNLDLSYTQILKMSHTGFRFRLKGEEDGQATFEELISLNRLVDLSLTLNRIPCDRSEDLSWIKRLRTFHFQIIQSQTNGLLRTRDKISNMNGLNLSQESIGWYWGNSSSLLSDRCQMLAEMFEDFIKSAASFSDLKSLTICNCTISIGQGGGCAVRCDLLPNLEELKLFAVSGLQSISELAGHLGLRFHNLKSIGLRDPTKLGSNQHKTLIEELFNCDSGQIMTSDPVVPNLRKLVLEQLPKLITLCRHEETWPRLEQVEVVRCKHLRRLPLTNQNAGTMKEIIGDSQWWDALEWDDDQTKSSLLPFFHPR